MKTRPAEVTPGKRKRPGSRRPTEEASKKHIMSWSKSRLHTSIFDLHRMGFTLTNLLLFTAEDKEAPTISDLTLYRLRVEARKFLLNLQEVINDLRPHVAQEMSQPDVAFAHLDTFDCLQTDSFRKEAEEKVSKKAKKTHKSQ